MAERREELVGLIEDLLVQAEHELEGPLHDDTSLIQSGLLDSVLILRLAEWIDGQVAAPIDLNETDIQSEWDTMDGILDYVRRHS